MRRAAPVLAAIIALSCSPAFAVSEKVALSFELGSARLNRGAPTGLDVLVSIEPGWHIQAHKPNEKWLIPTALEIEAPAGVTIHDVNYPRPDKASFAFAPGKEFLVYEGKIGLATALDVPRDHDGSAVPIKARLRYQACDDANCLPPATATAEITFAVNEAAAASPESTAPGSSDESRIAGWVERYGYVPTFALVFLLGLGLNLTPCVYPLISVTLSFFGTQAHGSTRRTLSLALLYVLGITITFSALGVAAALSGGLFGAALQKPIVLIALASLMTVLAMSCFGLYTLQPPPAVMRVVGRSATGAVGAVFMGLTMGIAAAPCVGPAVIGLLTFVASRQDPLLGFALFTTLSLGLGLPYVALAVVAPTLRSLPRSGAWLTWIEHLFGFVLLGLAVYFVKPLLPAPLKELALAGIVAFAAISLGFLDRAGEGERFQPVKRTAGAVGLAVALWLGWPSSLHATINWVPYSDTVLVSAKERGVPVVIDVGAEWCLPCKEMEVTTFRDPEVSAEAANFQMVKLDMTAEDEENERLTEQFLIRGVPTTLFLRPDGEEFERKVGYVSAEEMLEVMRRVRASSG